MKTESRLFMFAGGFLVGAGIVYGIVSNEYAGTAMLVLGGLACFFIGGYLVRQSQKVGERPEDRYDGRVEGVEEVGYFPTSSLWPLYLGAGAVVVANGLVFGSWLVLVGGLLLAAAAIGYLMESRSKA